MLSSSAQTRWRAVAFCVLALLLPRIARANVPIDVFIFAGQSNMMGTGDTAVLPASFSEAQEGVIYNFWENARSWPVPISTDAWLDMKARGNRFGSELTFGQTITDSVPGTEVGILKVAFAGTSLRRAWHPSTTAEPRLYPVLTSRIQAGLQRLTNNGYAPNLVAFVWVQGEGDAGNEPWAEDYDRDLGKLLSTLREDFNVPDLPIIFNQLHAESDQQFTDVLRQSQADFHAAEHLSTMIEMSDLPLKIDGVHFESITQITLGQRMAAAYLQNQGLPVTIRSIELLPPPVPEPGGVAAAALAALILRRRRPQRSRFAPQR